MGLYEKLTRQRDGGPYPLHMPGHKRNTDAFSMGNPYGIDITEIEGFDDLHCPEGILKEGMERAAAVYGSQECWYLINGSTAGVLAGIFACTKPGDRVLVARNCHKSVYHALLLNQLQPIYVMPEEVAGWSFMGNISPESIEKILREEEDLFSDPGKQERKGRISLVVLTSPTYEGILSDVPKIAAICHARGIPLLVDEAHGAHLGFAPFPEGAVAGGADLVVQSLHKTLPALTQTGLLHRQGTLVDGGRVKQMLDIFQTSSPSYILMAGIDECIRFLADNKKFGSDWMEMLREFRQSADRWQALRLLPDREVTAPEDAQRAGWRRDPSKLVISTAGTGHTGPELMELLRKEYGFELEMASADYVIAMTGAGDRREAVCRFAAVLEAIDRCWAGENPGQIREEQRKIDWRPQPRIPLWQAERMRGMAAEWSPGVIGRVCLEFVYAYPPGIPLLAPGEVISPQVWEICQKLQSSGICLQGMRDPEGRQVELFPFDN